VPTPLNSSDHEFFTSLSTGFVEKLKFWISTVAMTMAGAGNPRCNRVQRRRGSVTLASQICAWRACPMAEKLIAISLLLLALLGVLALFGAGRDSKSSNADETQD
jgi:hypothetical protein